MSVCDFLKKDTNYKNKRFVIESIVSLNHTIVKHVISGSLVYFFHSQCQRVFIVRTCGLQKDHLTAETKLLIIENILSNPPFKWKKAQIAIGIHQIIY